MPEKRNIQNPSQPENSSELVQFSKSTGIPIISRHKDKYERINETIYSFQSAFYGMETRMTGSVESDEPAKPFMALAQACSIFLRKMVIGDRNDRKTRLLDDRVLQSLDIQFDRIVNIPARDTRRIWTGLEIDNGFMRIEKKDAPKGIQHISIGRNEVKIFIDWPIPGTMNWTGTQPWPVSEEQLFDIGSKRSLNCDQWLAQGLVKVNGDSISLKDVIKMVVNKEGAHSVNTGTRLLRVEDEQPIHNEGIHILNTIKLFGVKYIHIIVVESALYLYGKLLDATKNNDQIDIQNGERYILQLGSFSERPDWLSFDGGMMLAPSPMGQVIHRTIKSINRHGK